jgi:Cu(I)/Ag(I) efflux system protein CusF
MPKSILAAIAVIAIASAAMASSHLVDGQVTKIDLAAGKITIKHGPIKKFDMDAMTMVFRAQKLTMLQAVKAGDKVRFEVDKINGQYTVTTIEKTD